MRAVWSQHPETDLVFVGRGDLEGPLKAQAAFTGHADRVRFLGWREDVREIMPLFDLLVLPSLNEGMGRVLLEAMAAGRPVVASRVGGIPDLVRDEENGLLVPPGDEQALAAGIARLLQDRPLARRLGEAGRASCREFGVDAMAARLDRMYRELLTPDTAVMDGPDAAHPQRGPAAMRNECWPTG
jgi:glycosyltransferase involved in cell wall biosynthesis